VRYAQGGGLTDAGRAVREHVRLKAVERFERREKNKDIADALRVTERSVQRWRRQWREQDEAGVSLLRFDRKLLCGGQAARAVS
jgi:hypothetical protein